MPASFSSGKPCSPPRALGFRHGFFALCAASGQLVVADIERHIGRFKPVSDHPIIGRHLVGDIREHVDTRVVLSRTERETAWILMEMIATVRRADTLCCRGNLPARRGFQRC